MRPELKAIRLYLIASSDPFSADPLGRVMEAVENGVGMVQLREKSLSSRRYYQLALELKRKLSVKNIPLIINDRVDIALAVDAHGVHLGPGDLPVRIARTLLGPEKIIGFSASNLKDALAGFREGADYIGAGALFPTETKKDVLPLSLDVFEEIARSTPLPVVAIGGITPGKASLLFSRGAAGLAVSSAILKARSVPAAVKLFLEQIED